MEPQPHEIVLALADIVRSLCRQVAGANELWQVNVAAGEALQELALLEDSCVSLFRAA